MLLPSCFQFIPARCQRAAQVQDTSRRPRGPRVLLCPHQLPQCLVVGLSVLHRRRAAPVRPDRGAAVHCGRQQKLRWLLEPSAVAGQKLQHLLPGYEPRQRGEFQLYPSRLPTIYPYWSTTLQRSKDTNHVCVRLLITSLHWFTVMWPNLLNLLVVFSFLCHDDFFNHWVKKWSEELFRLHRHTQTRTWYK